MREFAYLLPPTSDSGDPLRCTGPIPNARPGDAPGIGRLERVVGFVGNSPNGSCQQHRSRRLSCRDFASAPFGVYMRRRISRMDVDGGRQYGATSQGVSFRHTSIRPSGIRWCGDCRDGGIRRMVAVVSTREPHGSSVSVSVALRIVAMHCLHE